MKLILIIGIAACLLSGCSTASKLSQQQTPLALKAHLNQQLFAVQPINDADIFYLPAQEQQKFLNYFNQQQAANVREDKIIFNYLDKSLANFNYYSATLNANDSFKQQQGNCISLAILTQAYVQLVGLKTSFQSVSSSPVYSKENNVVYVSDHFRTKIYAPIEKSDAEEDNYLLKVPPGTIIDYFPTRGSFYRGRAELNDLISKFFTNLAAEALAKNELSLSYSYLLKANEYTPSAPELYNLAGVLHRRAGDTQTAKVIYQAAVQQNIATVNLIHNYILLAKQIKDKPLIARLNQQLESKYNDPFTLLAAAQNARSNNRYNLASKYATKAIAMAPYLSEPFIELAIIHHHQGHNGAAKQNIEHAITLENDSDKLALYRAKQFALSAYNE